MIRARLGYVIGVDLLSSRLAPDDLSEMKPLTWLQKSGRILLDRGLTHLVLLSGGVSGEIPVIPC